VEAAKAHLLVRKQFGQPLASFQVELCLNHLKSSLGVLFASVFFGILKNNIHKNNVVYI